MNFFEQELRRLFDDSGIVDDPIYSGRCCFAALGKDLRMRARFSTTRGPKEFDALELTVLHRTDGPLDTLILRFKDVMGMKIDPSHYEMRNGMEPHIWEKETQVDWNLYQPTDADYESIRQAAKQYLNMFRDRQKERVQGEPDLSIQIKAGQKPLGHVQIHWQAARKGRGER